MGYSQVISLFFSFLYIYRIDAEALFGDILFVIASMNAAAGLHT